MSSPRWDRCTFAACLGLIVWAPLPLGSNRNWAVGLLAMAFWSTIAVRALASEPWRRGHRTWWRLRAAVLPIGLLGAFCMLVALQWLGVAGDLLTTEDPFQTHVYLLRAVACLGAFVLTMLCLTSRDRIERLLVAIVAAGLLQAVLAVVLHATRAHYQFLFTDFAQGQRAMGTFPNPDHLAGYMELTLSAGLGLLLAQFGRNAVQRQRGWTGHLTAGLAFLMSAKMRLRLMLIVMVVALVMTHSRMGNAAFFLSLLLMGGIVALISTELRRPALWLVASMALVDVIVVGQWVGLDRVIERLQDTAESTAMDASSITLDGPLEPKAEESMQDRMRIPMLSMPLIDDHPWFGRGAGTYFLSLPSIKPAGFPHYWDHAHNDYIEVAVETGLVGLGLLLGMVAATAWRAAPLLRDGQPRLDRGVGVAALMAMLCMGLHSMVDFNLQIPANALTLVVLCAAVWAVSAQQPPTPRQAHPAGG